MRRSVLLSMMAANEAALRNRWSAAARAASSGSNWAAANLKRRALSAQQRADEQAAAGSPYSDASSPEGASGPVRSAKPRLPKTARGWSSLASKAYSEAHGRLPETDAEIAEAEESVNMPARFRTGGAPVADKPARETVTRERLDELDASGELDGQLAKWARQVMEEFKAKHGRYPSPGEESNQAARDFGPADGANGGLWESVSGLVDEYAADAEASRAASDVHEVDLPDAWDDFYESGLRDMKSESRLVLFRDIMARRKKDGDASLSGSDLRFLGEYTAAAVADHSRNGTAGLDPEHYEVLSETGYFDTGKIENRRAHYESLANRVESAAEGLLANLGWTDEARAASLLARRARAASRRAAAPASGTTPPPGITPPPTPPPPGVPPPTMPPPTTPPAGRPPATSGYFERDGGLWLTIRGTPTRLGSSDVLSIGADGTPFVRLDNGTVINLLRPPPTTYTYTPGEPRNAGLNSGEFPPGSGKVRWGNYIIDLNTGRILAS